MTNPLAPAPLTREEIVELVERVRRNEIAVAQAASAAGGRTAADNRRRGPVSRRDLIARHVERSKVREQALAYARSLRVGRTT